MAHVKTVLDKAAELTRVAEEMQETNSTAPMVRLITFLEHLGVHPNMPWDTFRDRVGELGEWAGK